MIFSINVFKFLQMVPIIKGTDDQSKQSIHINFLEVSSFFLRHSGFNSSEALMFILIGVLFSTGLFLSSEALMINQQSQYWYKFFEVSSFLRHSRLWIIRGTGDVLFFFRWFHPFHQSKKSIRIRKIFSKFLKNYFEVSEALMIFFW